MIGRRPSRDRLSMRPWPISPLAPVMRTTGLRTMMTSCPAGDPAKEPQFRPSGPAEARDVRIFDTPGGRE